MPARLIAPVLLIALVASIAAGVQRYASPAGGLQLPVSNTGDKTLEVHTGSLRYPREAVDSDQFTVRIPRPVHRSWDSATKQEPTEGIVCESV